LTGLRHHRQYKMNNQDLCLMWLSVWCSILQSMAFNQPGIWLNIFLRHLTGLRHHRQYKMNNQDLCLMWLSVWCSILQSMALIHLSARDYNIITYISSDLTVTVIYTGICQITSNQQKTGAGLRFL
ncbi:hypothetical protein ECO7815_13972, partial [Escherichia coli O55:H7 str. 3256-97]